MRTLKHLFENNQVWATEIKKKTPDFFEVLARQQNPEYFWIGCSDSRVPANEITGLMPGEVFVHRNVANLVIHTDLNCLSVIQYAVEVLQVKHIIVCGHLGCGGIKAAFERQKLGLIDNWLRHIQDIAEKYKPLLEVQTTATKKQNLLSRLNVIEQVVNLASTTILEDAWLHGQNISIHGWIYDIHDGILKDLGMCITHSSEIRMVYDDAIRKIESFSRKENGDA